MNDITTNKQRMELALAMLAEGDTSAFVSMCGEDLSWTVQGAMPWSGTYRGKASVFAMLRSFRAQLKEPFVFRTQRVLGDGDFVVVEGRGQNQLHTGPRYDNQYCWVCRFEAGQLRELNEYMDTELVARTLAPPAQEIACQASRS